MGLSRINKEADVLLKKVRCLMKKVLIKKETLAQVIFWEFNEILKNNFSQNCYGQLLLLTIDLCAKSAII